MLGALVDDHLSYLGRSCWVLLVDDHLVLPYAAVSLQVHIDARESRGMQLRSSCVRW